LVGTFFVLVILVAYAVATNAMLTGFIVAWPLCWRCGSLATEARAVLAGTLRGHGVLSAEARVVVVPYSTILH
jgi:hypothetical protein